MPPVNCLTENVNIANISNDTTLYWGDQLHTQYIEFKLKPITCDTLEDNVIVDNIRISYNSVAKESTFDHLITTVDSLNEALSVCIAAQKIHSRAANRIPSWHPDNSFPIDYNPNSDNLVIYILKTNDNQFWAGWFLKNEIPKNWLMNDELKQLFEIESAGYIKFKSKVLIDTGNKEWAFYFDAKEAKNQVKTEEDVEEDLLNQDTSPKLEELTAKAKPEVKERIFKIRQRNNQIVKNLKKLYKGHCQISGTEFTFQKKNGEWYSEVHHLIPLGENGSDIYANAIVVSPLIHRMLHYAKVSAIDLSQIKNNKLKIQINDKDFEISWNTDHFKTVEKSLKD